MPVIVLILPGGHFVEVCIKAAEKKEQLQDEMLRQWRFEMYAGF
jgi:hypothetical protein